VSDRDEILELMARYAHFVDDRDLDGIVALFTPDGQIDFEGGQSSGVSHDGIRRAYAAAFAQPVLARPSTSTHLMSNTILTLDGDHARAETEAVAYLADASTGKVVTRGLRYSDDLTRTSDGWRFAHRVHRSVWQTEAPGQVR
jgi:uncharacterized protein (TIGR02246 family)